MVNWSFHDVSNNVNGPSRTQFNVHCTEKWSGYSSEFRLKCKSVQNLSRPVNLATIHEWETVAPEEWLLRGAWLVVHVQVLTGVLISEEGNLWGDLGKKDENGALGAIAEEFFWDTRNVNNMNLLMVEALSYMNLNYGSIIYTWTL